MTCTVRPISAAAAFCSGRGRLGRVSRRPAPASAAPNPAPIASAAPRPRQTPRARQLRHPRRLRHDDGDGHRRHRQWRRACAGRRDRRGRPKAQRAGRARDQRRRHDRAAGADRNPLAHVEYAVAQHVGRESRSRAISAPLRRSARNSSPATCIRARGLPPPRRSTAASPSCTTGATTSAASIMPRPTSAR